MEQLEKLNSAMSNLATDNDRDVAGEARAVNDSFKRTPVISHCPCTFVVRLLIHRMNPVIDLAIKRIDTLKRANVVTVASAHDKMYERICNTCIIGESQIHYTGTVTWSCTWPSLKLD